MKHKKKWLIDDEGRKHFLQLETTGLFEGLRGYRCACREGIAAGSIQEARSAHMFIVNYNIHKKKEGGAKK